MIGALKQIEAERTAVDGKGAGYGASWDTRE
jgi:hypothetical protein